jgi:hypothetical protein
MLALAAGIPSFVGWEIYHRDTEDTEKKKIPTAKCKLQIAK